jgi:glycosyltransferase involved in cell wall biosynthesis
MTFLEPFHITVGALLTALAIHEWANRRVFPRLEPVSGSHPAERISVLIPARNEAAQIARCVRAWVSQSYANYEVLVYDDESSDDTAEQAAAAGDGKVRVIRGGALPDGWRGKPHACHHLRAEAGGDVLVFSDVDVVPAADTLAASAAALAVRRVNVFSALPLHTSTSRAVRAMVALQNWSAMFVPWWWEAAGRRPMFAAVNGQYIVIRRELYDRLGGFAAVRNSLAEDAMLGRRLIERGQRVPLLDAAGMLVCDPYRTLREAWRANLRNLLPIFFGSATLLLLAMSLLALLYLGPIVVLALGVSRSSATPVWLWLPLGEIALGMFTRWVADARFGYPLWVTLLHPLAVAGLIAMGIGSIVRYRLRRTVEWRGRRYSLSRRDAASSR